MTTDPRQEAPVPPRAAAAAASDPLGHPGPATGATAAPEPEAEFRARHESLGEMFASFSANLSTLFRQEIALAKAEATVEAKKAGTGAGMFAGAALAAVFVLLFLSTALMWALSAVMHPGWAALIVAVLWGIVAAVLALMGKKHFERLRGLRQTQETVQEIPATLNPNKETP
ncbi:phage holin family protein [Citricoccus sp. SGAir0253]|uniref:phage holin family protein n=1 Tax=Citricoccus sp. SGAir0253 TaxID=2567881 RepID=UPI0010CD2173|nr:phage holin family protein [Citricoccus sp. SGAir0253]